MGEAAVKAAQAVDYRGAGTVEFLYQDGSFYFLEMNTRLQVEHPVTELVTGLDLVHWQLRVAAGEPLGFTQEDVTLTGHAVECRITSEDPARGFLPSTGVVRHLSIPQGPGVRWDGGIAPGYEVGLHYDPLLGKLVVHAPDRPTAMARLRRALDELVVEGVDTCIDLHRRIAREPDFLEGDLSIRYLEEHPELLEAAHDAPGKRAAAVAAALLAERERNGVGPVRMGGAGEQDGDGGRRLSTWRSRGWPWSD